MRRRAGGGGAHQSAQFVCTLLSHQKMHLTRACPALPSVTSILAANITLIKLLGAGTMLASIPAHRTSRPVQSSISDHTIAGHTDDPSP